MKKEGLSIIIPRPRVININNTGSLENVAGEGFLCNSNNLEHYKSCNYYNTDFCRRECEFGVKETLTGDINLDNQEDGK
jgi:hypothetical protein